MSNNNNNDHPIANDPPMEEGGAGAGAGVRVSSDDAANSSEYPESTEQGESPSHGSSDAGSKTGQRDHEGGGGGGVGDRDAADAGQKPPAKSKEHKTSDDPNGHSREANAREPTFPVKLHRILSNEHEDIISWLPHGRSWRINNSKRFEEEVLPLYFRHGRYSSFARQVNGWGFKRVMQGSDYNSYYHELFLRNLPYLCERMRRLTTKDIASRKMDNSAVPDFYSLSRDHPLPETAEEGDHSPTASVAAAAATTRGKTGRRKVDHTPSSVTAVQAVSHKLPAIQGNVLMQTELQMLEKRRKEIVDRIAFLAANLGQSNPSDNYPSHLGTPPAAAVAASQPCGVDIGALTQQGMLALLRQPGGAQLLAQLAHGLQHNRQNNNQSQTISAPPPAFNQNPLLSIPGGIQLVQHLMSSNKSGSSQTSGLQVNAPAPVAFRPTPPAPQKGEAQLLLERLMQVINNRNTNDYSTVIPTPPLVSSSAHVTSPVQAPHLSPPVAATAPPSFAGLPAAILQVLSAQQQQGMHASMPRANNYGGANGPNAILLQMLTNAAAAAATAPAPPPAAAPAQPFFVPSSTGQNNNVSDAAAMIQQLLQNGNLDLASLLSMSHASLNPQDKKRGN